MKTLTRKQFVNWLIKKAEKDEKICLLTGDLGFGFLHEFADKFPKRFLNCGVIEQSMIGIACGLAIAGYKPFVYSTSTFLIFRALEQIRNDIGYQGLDVTLVGTAGPQYNFLGYTHVIQNDEDFKILKAINKKIKYIRLI
jgi:transketolase